MKKITIFDTSAVSKNVGDFIIMDSVNRELRQIFHDDMFFYSLTHDKISKGSYRLNEISDYSFIGGTNLLSSNMHKYNQWKINLVDSFKLNDICLMGVGWWQYQNKPNFYTKTLLASVLSKTVLHSVRDSYTKNMLKSIGISNVINTGCPTMWNLTPEHCKTILTGKAKHVVFTLTDYSQDPYNDQKLIDILISLYEKVHFWPQGSEDIPYLKKLNCHNRVEILGGNLDCFDMLLDNKELSLDYVGTRLHAGIRALQKKRRSIILGIDNRAAEKSKDFNLGVVARHDVETLTDCISGEIITDIKINLENIEIWKNQFKK